MVGPCVTEHSCPGQAIREPQEMRAEECEHFLGFHSILGEGASAAGWEGLQPRDVLAIMRRRVTY